MYDVLFVQARQKFAFSILVCVVLFKLKFVGYAVFLLLTHVCYVLREKKKFFFPIFFKKKNIKTVCIKEKKK